MFQEIDVLTFNAAVSLHVNIIVHSLIHYIHTEKVQSDAT